MGNEGSRVVTNRPLTELAGSSPEESKALAHAPTPSCPIIPPPQPVRGRYSLQLLPPIPPKLERAASTKTRVMDEPIDGAETEEPPLRSSSAGILGLKLAKSNSDADLFQLFRKELAETDEVSLYELNSPCDADLISMAMADIRTRASMGHSNDHDDDEDVISLAEFQNIKPFEFHEHLRSSRDVVKALQRPAERPTQ